MCGPRARTGVVLGWRHVALHRLEIQVLTTLRDLVGASETWGHKIE